MQRFAELGAVIAGYGYLALSFLIAVSVIGRKAFDLSFLGANEIGGYVLACGVALSLGSAVSERMHIRMDLLVTKLPRTPEWLLNFLAELLMMAFAAFLLWRGFATLMSSINLQAHSNSPLEVPLWIPQGIWVLGLAWFTVTCAYLSIITLLNRPNTSFGSVVNNVK